MTTIFQINKYEIIIGCLKHKIANQTKKRIHSIWLEWPQNELLLIETIKKRKTLHVV